MSYAAFGERRKGDWRVSIFAKNSLVPIAAITALVVIAEIKPNIKPKKFPVGSVYW
jgi:hypothetical protein